MTVVSIETYEKGLYELRFSPMCKPAAEVANLTQLESHTTRSKIMMLWRIAVDYIGWKPREVEIIYESTLDSISEAFDVFHYPISQYMLAARAGIWKAGLAPQTVTEAVRKSESAETEKPHASGTVLLAGEIAQLGDETWLISMLAALERHNIDISTWVAHSSALAYSLGA